MGSWSISSFVSGSDRVEGALPRSFYERHTVAVANELLGKVQVTQSSLCLFHLWNV
jgi:hypothetical protein